MSGAYQSVGVTVGYEASDADARRWRIEALRRYAGESVEDVITRRFESASVRAPDIPITADQHRWMERVAATVRGVHRDFLAVADAPSNGEYSPRMLMFDESASVALQVGPDAVEVIPLPDYDGDARRGFALMWRLCQALARDAECIIVDPTDLTVVEMQLDVDRAREEYGWL
ncbi:MAG: hypothetical protein JWL83_1597 [Actinomycetia bacterium]|nr:hypothetical protein [Actinomycetes bacterium]